MPTPSNSGRAWLILFIRFNLLTFPQFVLGLPGMPRRYFDYLPQFKTGEVISSIFDITSRFSGHRLKSVLLIWVVATALRSIGLLLFGILTSLWLIVILLTSNSAAGDP